MMPKKSQKLWLGLGSGVLLGWAIAQQAWVFWQLKRRNVHHTLAHQTNQGPSGLQFSKTDQTDDYVVTHTIEDGIERIVYSPTKPRFKTPILMQHGMWHGAWCWSDWQALFAKWGWESHAFSLPGHAGSPTQRPISLCTLDYYLSFLKAEVDRLETKPVLLGHSMGGALTQWYLNYVGDLPAAVLVAPWVSHSMLLAGYLPMLRLDPLSSLLVASAWNATPMVRTPQRAASALISDGAHYTPEALYEKLGPESALVIYQHNPPFWTPPEQVNTPMLWLAGEQDALVIESEQRPSAKHYSADYLVIEQAAHNLMMEHNYEETAQAIHHWLCKVDNL
ncbi:MAG: alpha/beta hydrolase [Chloroflexota bacterium]